MTSFFGVNYRELVQDILESIERGVEEEHGKGTLQPEEAEVSVTDPSRIVFTDIHLAPPQQSPIPQAEAGPA